MYDDEFIEKAIDMVLEYHNNNPLVDNEYNIKESDVHIKWMSHILGNNKALLSTNDNDEMYYMVTYDKLENKFYFDTYKKWTHEEYNNGDETIIC